MIPLERWGSVFSLFVNIIRQLISMAPESFTSDMAVLITNHSK